MIRFGVILSLLLATLPPLPLAAGSHADTPAACCCCPVGACECGCGAADEQPSSDDQKPEPRICACDATPLGMPNAAPTLPDRLAVAGVLDVVSESADSRDLQHRFDHPPHGPPPQLGPLATIILLN